MESKKIGIIIVILILVFILIISFIPKKETVPRKTIINYQGPPKIVVNCEEKCNQNVKCLEACYYFDINKAVVAQDTNLCNKIPSLIKQSCIDKINLGKALTMQDTNLCNPIINQETKTICLNALK